MLRQFLKQWVLHIRDPRSVLLSWVHHVDYYRTSRQQDLFWVYPLIYDASYFSLSLAEKIDFNIRNYLPSIVEWITDWLLVIERGEDRILLVTYDDLVHDERAFIDKILDSYEIPVSRFKMPKLLKTIEVSHYRVGETDEWRDVFSEDQLTRANNVIGKRMRARFGWAER